MAKRRPQRRSPSTRSQHSTEVESSVRADVAQTPYQARLFAAWQSGRLANQLKFQMQQAWMTRLATPGAAVRALFRELAIVAHRIPGPTQLTQSGVRLADGIEYEMQCWNFAIESEETCAVKDTTPCNNWRLTARLQDVPKQPFATPSAISCCPSICTMMPSATGCDPPWTKINCGCLSLRDSLIAQFIQPTVIPSMTLTLGGMIAQIPIGNRTSAMSTPPTPTTRELTKLLLPQRIFSGRVQVKTSANRAICLDGSSRALCVSRPLICRHPRTGCRRFRPGGGRCKCPTFHWRHLNQQVP